MHAFTRYVMTKTQLAKFYEKLATGLRARGIAAEETSRSILMDDPKSWAPVIAALAELGWTTIRKGTLAYAYRQDCTCGLVLQYHYGLSIGLLHEEARQPGLLLPSIDGLGTVYGDASVDMTWMAFKDLIERQNFKIQSVPGMRLHWITTDTSPFSCLATHSEETGTVSLLAV